MKARVWLTLGVAVLFGAQTPLCALACVDPVGAGVHAGADVAHPSEGPPCHESGPDPAPSPGSSEHTCGCDSLRIVAAKSDGKVAGAAPLLTPPLASAPALRIAGAAVAAPLRLRDPHRPPPDLLLLKSSLRL